MTELLYKIEKEYNAFKNNVMKTSPEEIWEKCHQIYFYSSIYEYFIYNDKIPVDIVDGLKNHDNIIAECWQLYLKKEELSVFTWKDITALLQKCVEFMQLKAAKMDYPEFEKTICELLVSKMEGIRVEPQKVVKNNAVELRAIAVMEDGCKISPFFYPAVFYEDYLNGMDIDEIVENIIQTYIKRRYKGDLNIEELLCWEKINSRIICRFVNKEKNMKLLSEIPYVSWCDLAIVFYILLKNDDKETATVMISRKLCDRWNKTAEELLEIAMPNTAVLFPPIYTSLDKMIGNTINDMRMLNGGTGEEMIAISNKQLSQGAIVILYQDILTKVADELQSDIYILPSSTHEVLAISDRFCPREDLLDMVKDINKKLVCETEILSDNIYHFDRATHMLHMYSKEMPEMEIDMDNNIVKRSAE